MSGFAVVVAALLALAGFLAGALAVPKAANMLLARSYRRSRAWWWESRAAYEEFLRAHPGQSVSAKDPGRAGALGAWLSDVRAACRRRSITRERAESLPQVGIDPGVLDDLMSEDEQEKRCTFCATPAWRVGLGALVAAWFAGVLFSGLAVPEAVLLDLGGAVMATAVVCDMRSRIIPLECCSALAVVGVAFQALLAGVEGVAAGAVAAGVVLALAIAANRFAFKGSCPIGFGDIRCMAALSLASAGGVFAGAVACYAVAAVVSAAGVASRKLGLKDGLPMAPFLTLWFAVGTLSCR